MAYAVSSSHPLREGRVRHRIRRHVCHRAFDYIPHQQVTCASIGFGAERIEVKSASSCRAVETPGEGEPSATRFECLLDEQPTELVPKQLLDRQRESASQLVVNPSLCFGTTALQRLPYVENFSRDALVIWILDPATDVLLPFWIGPKLLPWLANARPGQPLPNSIPPEIRSLLSLAGVLVPTDHRTRRRKAWRKAAGQYRSEFERNYVVIPSLLHPFHIGALRRYYRELMCQGYFHSGDDQCRDRMFAYNESVARFFQYQLTAMVSDIVGEPVQPSFSYVVCYRGGAELAKHTDREQCEFSISLSLDYEPEPADYSPWPLYLETEQETVAVTQAIGEALLFRGIQVPHYRPTLPEGSSSTSILFFYVRRSFTGALE